MNNIKLKINLTGILLMALFSSCEKAITENGGNTNSDEFCIPDSLVKNLTLDTVNSDFVMSTLKLPGKISFNEDKVIKVFPMVSGHVAKVKVSLGDYVTKGQVLAEIKSSEMANYVNDYKIAELQLAIAKKNLDVTSELKISGVSSEKDYLNAENEYQEALSAFNKTGEVMKIYGSDIHKNDSLDNGYLIKSPIDGFIVEKNVNSGMDLRADEANSLFTISDLTEVWAIANVYETDISKIKTGADVEISTLSYPEKIFKGKVERISNILNPETNAMTVKIKLVNADYTLKPGMFANISILFPEESKMLKVSSKAILFDDNKNYVVLFHKRCDVDLQEVKISKTFNDVSYIESDSIHEGDLVIERNVLFVFTALKKL